MNLLTNTPWLDQGLGQAPVDVVRVQNLTLLRQIMRVLPIWRYDAILLNIEARLLYLACLLKKLMPWTRCRLLSVDLILTRPAGVRERVRFMIRRWLLSEVDRFVLYYRDTAELRRCYDISASRVRYVPFKINTLEHVTSLVPHDEGFFLACGRSNRDYRTLCEAFRALPYSCRILAQWDNVHEHGTLADDLDCPPNVTLVSDDGSPESWNSWIARARCVVLPIKSGMLSPSGIGTYLVAMALGKPVIITDSAATRGILDASTAVLVPPNDEDALRAAVIRIAEEADFRSRIAEGGQAYALALGGEARLRDDVVAELADLLAPSVAPVISRASEVPDTADARRL